jgi:predicted signal transduction protein with EAL and GGDEF domain
MINGRPVQRFAYANAIVYFLRLPDGNIVNGTVYTPHPQAIGKLRDGETDVSEAIDSSTRYAGWSDLVSTLAAIVAAERVNGSGLSLHIAETDESKNPGDHPDHRATALAMEEVARRFPCASTHRYDEYATRGRPQNVKGEDYIVDVGTWAATASGLSDSHARATWEPEHNAWIGRSYSRSKAPSATCSDGRVS